MATDHKLQPESQQNNGRYEKRDANVKWLFAIVGMVLLLVVCSEFVMKWTKNSLEKTQPPMDQFAGVRRTTETNFTQARFPRLQVSPPEDLKKFRASEDAEMTNYGWINKTSGTVRIPIDRAMDLLLQRGLPVRAGIGKSKLGPTWMELQQQRTNATQPETITLR